jgi:hypothetical protein
MRENGSVRTSMLTSPRWALAAATGFPAGVVVGFAVGFLTPAPWVPTLICGVLAAALVGSGVDAWARTQRERVRFAVGDLPPGQLVAAFRAARSGPPPADPDVRSSALKIANHQLELVPSKAVLVLFMPVIGVTALVTTDAIAAPDWTVWFIVALALLSGVCAGVLAWQVFCWPKRLNERIRLLSAVGNTEGS